MLDAYKTDTLTQHGKTYRVDYVYDHDTGAPWENSDCHGPVSEWTTRTKKPGERILNSSGQSKRYYDVQQATLDAVTVWGCSHGENAAEAVEKDFRYLSAWCNDEWHYCGIVVTLLGDGGEETDTSASLWGIESDADGYHASVIQDLIGECEHDVNRRTYAGATVGA